MTRAAGKKIDYKYEDYDEGDLRRNAWHYLK